MLWESATNVNIFDEDGNKSVTVNLVFDERQEFVNAEKSFSNQLDETKSMSESLESEYEQLVASHAQADREYKAETARYETALEIYNQEVEEWNQQGGAPKEEFEVLNQTKETLDRQKNQLNVQLRNLNTLVDEINQLTNQANQVVEQYNESVEQYNHSFSETTEFTQGDYQSSEINIYKFSTYDELVLVLAHEMGHAIGIGHVENSTSIMFSLMKEQTVAGGVSEEDIAAFVYECGDGSIWAKLTRISFW
jgi:predicted Zn-dependent protease